MCPDALLVRTMHILPRLRHSCLLSRPGTSSQGSIAVGVSLCRTHHSLSKSQCPQLSKINPSQWPPVKESLPRIFSTNLGQYRNGSFCTSHQWLNMFTSSTAIFNINGASVRLMSAQAQPKRPTSLSQQKTEPNAELTVGQKVARAGKDATYTGVVVVGVIITGLIFFTIGRELFSGQSPSGIYQRAYKKCKQNDDVYVLLGAPLKAYGEQNRRGRRRFTSHSEFIKDGVKHMRMKFYIEGPSQKGTVHLEAKQDEAGKYQFRYIFIEADTGLRGPIVVLDER